MKILILSEILASSFSIQTDCCICQLRLPETNTAYLVRFRQP